MCRFIQAVAIVQSSIILRRTVALFPIPQYPEGLSLWSALVAFMKLRKVYFRLLRSVEILGKRIHLARDVQDAHLSLDLDTFHNGHLVLVVFKILILYLGEVIYKEFSCVIISPFINQ